MHYFYLVWWRDHTAIIAAKENPNYDYFFLCASQNETHNICEF